MSRFLEPSTWAGLSGGLAALASLPIPDAQPWLVGLASFSGAIAVYLRESSSSAKKEDNG